MKLLDFLNDLSAAPDARPYHEALSFGFRIAEQCKDPEDVAESVLFSVVRGIEADAKYQRELAAQAERSTRLYGTGDGARIEYAGRAAELEALAARIRAALKPAPDMRTAA